MALHSQRYTLVGFSKELDRRPLHFVEPIPANRICRACGLVSRSAAFLPCLHVVCKTCYEQCRLDDDNSCPLDGSVFREEDVDWRDFPADLLLRRQVKCWNENHGCEMVTDASSLYEHFFQDCDYHTTSCPKCSATVLCSAVCAHLRSDCADHALSAVSGAPRASSNDPEVVLRALNAALDTRVSEMKGRLDEVMSESSAQSDRLNELSHCMNAIKEALLQPLASGTCTVQSGFLETAASVASIGAVKEVLVTHRDRLAELSRSVNILGDTLNKAVQDAKRASLVKLEQNATNQRLFQAELSEHMKGNAHTLEQISRGLSEFKEILLGREPKPAANSTTLEACATNSPPTTVPGARVEEGEQQTQLQRSEPMQNKSNSDRQRLIVKGIESIKACLNLDGFYDYVGEKMYLSDYHIMAGLKLVKEDGCVSLHARVKLLKGINDESLEWPFYRNIKLSALHPSSNEQRYCVSGAFRSVTHFGKPGPVGNKALFFQDSSLCLDDLEREGYVVNDKLTVMWELIPPLTCT